MRDPQPKPTLPMQFIWTALLSGLDNWLYEIKCKWCGWNKLSDYDNVQEWAQYHQCSKRSK